MVQVASSQSTKNGVAPRVRDRVGARRERQVRAGDLVAGADPEDDERQVKRGRAARERDRVGDAGDGRELALEGVDVRPERGDPVRLDRLRDQLCLAAGEVGWGQVDARHRVAERTGARRSGRTLGDGPAQNRHGVPLTKTVSETGRRQVAASPLAVLDGDTGRGVAGTAILPAWQGTG